MTNLAYATIEELRHLLDTKQISIQELIEYYVQRSQKYNPELGAALEIFSADSVLKNLKPASTILSGIPGMIKDNICQEGRTTSCASKILEHFKAPYNATAIERLNNAGACSLGRANLDEFAMGSSTETSAFLKTRNPWDLTRVPGGSSGGSIAAVAAGMVPWALGSETGGSVRLPAAFCGVVGIKPTYGLVSRYGLVAYASSFDQIGVVTRTVKDNAHVLSAIAGHDKRDSTTLAVESLNYARSLTGKIKPGLTIGIIDNAFNAEGIEQPIKQALDEAIKTLQTLGATVKRVSLPTMDYSAAVYFVLSRAEAASNLARFDGVRYGTRAPDVTTLGQLYSQSRSQGFGREVKARIMIGNYVLSAGHADAYYSKAKQVQRMMRAEFTAIFKDVDLLLAPTHPAPAFKFGAFDDNKLQLDLLDYFTCAANITGVPAISVPCGFTPEKLPIGFQLIGAHCAEELLYQTAYAYEQATPWHTMHPTVHCP